MRASSVPALLFALFSAAMLGLAAGAAWMVVALYSRHPLPWLAVPIGVALAWVIRAGVRQPGTGAMLLAAGATGLSAIYVNLLIAGVKVAGSMGLDLIEAMRTAGIGMLWQLARMGLTPANFIWTLLAMLLAGWLASRQRRPRRPPPQKKA
jgi:vitamin B12 transport system permease protein